MLKTKGLRDGQAKINRHTKTRTDKILTYETSAFFLLRYRTLKLDNVTFILKEHTTLTNGPAPLANP